MTAAASQAESEVQAPAKAQTAGAWLRAARQSKGLHIAALAAQLKVPQAKLEALEADRYQDLPDATFARALAKAMCRVLKVDAAPVMALLPRGAEPGLDRVTKGLNEPFRERSGALGAPSLGWLKRPVIWAPAGLLLAALFVYLMPADWLGTALPAAEPVLMQTAPSAEVLSAAADAASASVLPQADMASAPLAAELQANSTAATTSQSATPLAAPPATAAALQPGQAPLRLAARSESWVEVVDAKGQVLFSKLMRAGESTDLNVTTPVRLRIGNAAGTDLSLRGTQVDLMAQARDNVARIELN